MIGIKFGDLHSYNDLGLRLLSESKIDPPEPYLNEIEIPGRNGIIDYSEALTGEITYKQRELKLAFTLSGRTEYEYEKKYERVKNALHGRRVELIPDFDNEFYYEARLKVEEVKESDAFAVIKITGMAAPYKYKVRDTIITKTLTSTLTPIPCKNLRKPVVPIFKTTGQTKIEFEGKTISIGAGTHTLDIVFRAGLNTIKASGTGTLTITYREGGI